MFLYLHSRYVNTMRVGAVSRVLVSGIGVTLFGLVFSVVWSIIYDFESSTATHCKPKVNMFQKFV